MAETKKNEYACTMSDDELKKKLSPLQYEVMRKNGTERPFENQYWNNKKAGIYVDAVTGEPLFSSTDKFDSGSGWPSFTHPIEKSRVVEKKDSTHGMDRTEVRSKGGDSHLGHVFDDGPKDAGGLRYCINSASLRFIPVEDLEKEGYAQYKTLFEKNGKGHEAKGGDGARKPQSDSGALKPGAIVVPVGMEAAVLAGGCFWGMEDLLRKMPGVVSTRVGYTGGNKANPTYEDVKTGRTGHAESIEIVFDPKKTSYEKILRFFFRIHDPTTLNRQGNDVGSQYRSAIFPLNEKQKATAKQVIAAVEATHKWDKKVVTTVEDVQEFWEAEGYHQDYLEKHPGGYTCHYVRNFEF